MSEAVKSAILKTWFVLELLRESLREWSDDFADKHVANGVRFEAAATRAMKDVLVNFWKQFQYLQQLSTNGEMSSATALVRSAVVALICKTTFIGDREHAFIEVDVRPFKIAQFVDSHASAGKAHNRVSKPPKTDRTIANIVHRFDFFRRIAIGPLTFGSLQQQLDRFSLNVAFGDEPFDGSLQQRDLTVNCLASVAFV